MKNLEQIVNLNYLKKLSGGDTQLVVDMIKLFITEITTEIQLIEKGIIDNDFTLIKSSIHSIKGIIHYVGLNKVIKPDLIKIEKLTINQWDIIVIDVLFLKIKLKKVIHELNDWLLLSNSPKNY